MKYAYVIGSNAFIVPSRVVGYSYKGEEEDFLRINSIYHDLPPTAEQSVLNIDLNIRDTNGSEIKVVANKSASNANFSIKEERDSIHLLRPDGSTIIHIQQLDDESAMGLEHNITAELEVHAPIAVIRIFGDFIIGKLHISAENEKLFINDNGYANSVLTGKNQLEFTIEGVVL
jgi:hypothetical protein